MVQICITQVAAVADDVGGGGGSYTAGSGISIANRVISVKYGTGLSVDQQTGNVRISPECMGKINGIDAIRSDIAPEFSAESSYSKGDLRYHSGVLYRAKADIAAGAWDSTKWETATVAQTMASKDYVDAALGDIETLLAAL